MKTEQNWQELPVNYTIDDIGAPLITNLAQGLYAAPAVVREYVQNAVDSYVEFAKEIGERPSNEVRIDVQGNSLHIFDDGIGMGKEEIQKAKKIAVSDKPYTLPELYVGFRGIGIWAGLAACKRLVIKSSRFGDKFMYRLRIDFEEIAKNAQKPISIKDLLDPNVHLDRKSERPEIHYTHVELQDLTPQYEKLIDPEFLKSVIVETSPTEFEPTFPYGVELQKWLEGYGVNFYKIFLKGKQVFRDYSKKVNVPRYKELDVDGNVIAVGWACINSNTGKLDENGSERRNISLRVKNFAVGERGIYSKNDERWRQLGFENIGSPEHLDWYAGEVHVLDNEIIPNTPRTELEDSYRARQFIGTLRQYYDELTTDVRVHSEKVNAEKDIQEAKDLVEKLKTVEVAKLDQSKALDWERKVSKILQDLKDDDSLATRKIAKSGGASKLMQKKVKSALSVKQLRDDRGMLIAKLNPYVRELRAKLGINEPNNQAEIPKGSKRRTPTRSSEPSLPLPAAKANDRSQKDGDALLQAIIKVIENILGVESEDYAKICSQIEELFHKRGLI